MDRIVIVTGMSGAGRTTCLKIFEDLGFEAVDNLPVSLLSRLLRPDGPASRDLAVGIDSRTRGFEPQNLVAGLQRWRIGGVMSIALLYLDCDDEVLRRRFTKSRRRHPLASIWAIAEALSHERKLMLPLKIAADLVVDTSDLPLPKLRQMLTSYFARDGSKLAISVVSFSYKLGLPREADLIFDVRFLHNPHYVPTLQPETGLSPDVQEYIQSDPDFDKFIGYLKTLLELLLPRYRNEGKSYLTIGIGCTGGKHRSVYIAELVGSWLHRNGWEAIVVHRDLPRSTKGVAEEQPELRYLHTDPLGGTERV